MTASDVERLVRRVIVDHALPFTFVSVGSAPPGWNVSVRSEAGEVVTFPLRDGRAVDMRVTVHDFLDERS